jgi:hypothetical protein
LSMGAVSSTPKAKPMSLFRLGQKQSGREHAHKKGPRGGLSDELDTVRVRLNT